MLKLFTTAGILPTPSVKPGGRSSELWEDIVWCVFLLIRSMVCEDEWETSLDLAGSWIDECVLFVLYRRL